MNGSPLPAAAEGSTPAAGTQLRKSPAAGPTKVRVNGVDLHYIEQGRGEPLILLHGGQGDYRSWGAQVEALSPHYRVISYSRRYNFPNDNPLTAKYRSAYADADDLAAFIRRLRLGRVHLVGTSAGALTALVLATKNPGMVQSMVLADPPVLRWAKEEPAAEAKSEAKSGFFSARRVRFRRRSVR